MTPQEFLELYAHDAVASMYATGVPASVTLAQAILESGWGEHAPKHNFFGIKGTGSVSRLLEESLRRGAPVPEIPENLQVLYTNEWRAGRLHREQHVFRVYQSPAESFVDHGLFLRENKRYAKAFEVCSDGREFARRIAAAGYATAPDYADQLIRLIDKYHLDEYDKE